MKVSAMFASFKNNYKEFKDTSLIEQVIRASNMMFGMFTFWNVLRVLVEPRFASLSLLGVSLVVLGAVLVGVVFGVLLLLKLSFRSQLLVLPLTMTGFALSSTRYSITGLVAVPAFALGILVVVRLLLSLCKAALSR